MRKILDRLINSATSAETELDNAPKFQDTVSSLEALLSSPGVRGSDRLALEPRILLDAAGVDTAEAAMNEVAQADADAWAEQVAHNDNLSDQNEAHQPVSREILFIDAAVEDREAILAEVHPSIEVVVLHSDRDGVEQMAQALAGREGVDAIHIVSHGRSGTLDLGSTKLTEASMNGRHADEMAIIRSALSEDADLLIYGCDFAANARGVSAVEALAIATGADVAASDDLTGAASFGGDWQLEVEQGEIDSSTFEALLFGGVLAQPVANDDGPIAITGNTPTMIDPRATDANGTVADTDGDGDPLTITQIIDPSDGTVHTLVDNTPITLKTKTNIERLPDGTLSVTTSVLGQGTELFDYVIDDGNGGTDTATVTLDRSQGSLVVVPTSASGAEDNAIPLGITIDPALTAGGSQLDLVSTAIGYRENTDGTTPATFTIPPRTTTVQITAMGGYDHNANNGLQENRQSYTVTVDLVAGTYSGHVLSVSGNNIAINDNYAFSDVALGSGSYSAANLVGDNGSSINELTVSVIGNTLSLVETQAVYDQAYLVEFLTADGTSSDYRGSTGAILDRGTTASETTATFATDANADFLVINIQDGAGSNNNENEDNGGGRIIVDLDTGLASGVLYAQVGSGGKNGNHYSFSGYDITSGALIVDPTTRNGTTAGGATLDGKTSTSALDRLPNYIISMSGNDLVLERTSDYADKFESLINVQAYERFDEGSGAQTLGSDATASTYSDAAGLVTWDLDIAGGAETGVLTLTSSHHSPGNANANDHGATARIFVDLVNGTTSGSYFQIRTVNPDLIVWTDVPFGTRLVDAIGTQAQANFADLTTTSIDIVGALQFDLVDNPDGSQTLRASAQADGVNDTTQDWFTVMQVQWSGREAVTITGYPNGGSFSAGALNATTGEWEVEAENITGMEFNPPEHFSGQTSTTIIDYNGEFAKHRDQCDARVADAPVSGDHRRHRR